MNNKIATGIWLVFAGVVFLLHNFKLIDFNFGSILNLWPLLLVSIGVNLLLQNRQNGKYLVVICNILLCVFVFYQGMNNDHRSNTPSWTNTNNSKHQGPYSEQVSYDWNEEIQAAELTLSGGASTYSFTTSSDSSKLIEAKTTQPSGALKLKSSGDHEVALELTSTRPDRGKNTPISIDLNQKPTWDFIFNLGASSISADFRELQLGSMELNSGASAMTLHLPVPKNGVSTIEVNTAASKIKLYLPKDTDCRVETETIVSNNKYEDVDLVNGNERKSSGYDSASNKYDIKISGAANSVSILRY
ncbi:MAG: LiaF transmembrane domain-containing protein [Sphingobacterium sp.]